MNERSLAENSTRADPRKTGKRSLPKVDFLRPAGAPALYAPDSLAWQIFKNPVSLFIGGITAVLLELGEERVRSGVWNHSIFATDPITRMRRTGLATHVSVYAPVPVAEKLIGVVRPPFATCWNVSSIALMFGPVIGVFAALSRTTASLNNSAAVWPWT